MWQDSAGHYYGVITGKPARFRQQREGIHQFMEGESLRIEYDGKEDLVTLISNADKRRLEGDILRDRVAGDRLTYNNLTEKNQVDSSDGQGRSRMFLMPKSGAPLGTAR